MAHLPGSIGELIGDLRRNKGWSQKELAKRSGVTESTLSRIESGITKQVDATALGKIALVLNTSTDYLLGLTSIRTPKHIDITKLGLSEEAAKQLLSPAFKTEILNQLIEHPQFPYLLRLIDVYFSGAMAEGVLSRNEILSGALSMLTDYRKAHQEQTPEIREDEAYIRSQKAAQNEAELEQIRNTFMAILRDIRKNVEQQEPTSPELTRKMWQEMAEQLSKAEDGTIIPPTKEEMAALIAGSVGKTGALDDEGMRKLQEIMVQMLGNVGKKVREGN
jgi:hypothetical protein